MLRSGEAEAQSPSACRVRTDPRMEAGPWFASECKDRVKDKCLSQFASIEPDGHHRVTRRFLDPDFPGSLRPDVDLMSSDGGGMTPRLRAAVNALEWIPLDDCVCEGPRAQAKRIKVPAAAAKWTWIAISMRLRQNLADCMTLPASLPMSLKTVWSSYSTVVQPHSKMQRTPRMKPLDLQRRLYRLDHLLGFRITKPVHQAALADTMVAPPALQGGMADEDVLADGNMAAPHRSIHEACGRHTGSLQHPGPIFGRHVSADHVTSAQPLSKVCLRFL